MPKKPRKTRPVYMGIDPGKKGGLAIVGDQRMIAWSVMPTTVTDLFLLFREWADAFDVVDCALEHVQSRPGEGHKGAFTFGEGYGMLKMGLTATRTPYRIVNPRTWQKELKIKIKAKSESKPQFKERLRAVAQRRFPGVELWTTPKTLGQQRAICDALLLAEYCRVTR